MRMKKFWGRQIEKRSSGYTDTLLAHAWGVALGEETGAGATGALEIACSMWAAAFRGARVAPEGLRGVVTPAFLSNSVRAMVRRGEAVWAIDTDKGTRLLPAGAWDITGGHDPENWMYVLQLHGPSGNTTKTLPAAGVVHFRWAHDPERPWKGVSPMEYAKDTGRLAGALEKRLAEETGGPVGHFITIPRNPDATRDGALQTAIRNAAGRAVLVETTAHGYTGDRQLAPQRDHVQTRFGADPPPELGILRTMTNTSVLAACGAPAALASADADGTARREALRQWVMSGVVSRGREMAGELSVKLEADVRLDFSGLWGHDLVGKTSAYRNLTDAKVSGPDARQICGLTELAE